MGEEISSSDFTHQDFKEYQARQGLMDLGLDDADIASYLGIIEARVESGRNGAEWRRAFVEGRGADMKELCCAYRENQATGDPVHQWPV